MTFPVATIICTILRWLYRDWFLVICCLTNLPGYLYKLQFYLKSQIMCRGWRIVWAHCYGKKPFLHSSCSFRSAGYDETGNDALPFYCNCTLKQCKGNEENRMGLLLEIKQNYLTIVHFSITSLIINKRLIIIT